MNVYWFTNTNRLYYILAAAIVIVVFLTVILVLRNIGTGGISENSSITFWGVFDTPSNFTDIIREFEKQNQGIKVSYRQFSFEDYERTLINSLAAGTGPDVFMIHNTWIPKHGDKMVAMPDRMSDTNRPLLTIAEFRQQFVDVVYSDLTSKDRIYAMPLYVDTLALYYNKDLLNSAGIASPPKTWEEFNLAVEKLTRLDSRGNIVQSGVAMGTAENINRSTDILMALMVQNGTQMNDPNSNLAAFSRSVNGIRVGDNGLQYYTDFANPRKRTYTWNNAMDFSIDSFVEGETAMMFNYYHQIELLRNRAPRLNFTVAPFPQLSDTDIKNYANYWAVAVSNASKSQNQSWRFINYLASRDGSTRYLTETNRPSARRDIIELQKDDFELGIFASQALSARSWYQIDNVAIEDIFAEMIEDINFNRATISQALRSAESKINVLVSKNRMQ